MKNSALYEFGQMNMSEDVPINDMQISIVAPRVFCIFKDFKSDYVYISSFTDTFN